MGSIRISRFSADFVEDAVIRFLKENDRNLSCLSDLDDTDKNAKSEDTVIIAVGNPEYENQEEVSKVLQFFDFNNEKWIPLMKISSNYGLDCCNILAIENYVLLFDPFDATKTMVYNSKTGKLDDSKWNIPEHNKLVALEGRVYAIGFDGDDLSAKVLEDGDWKIGASMSMEREGASVVAHDGKIYVFGGEHAMEGWSEVQTAEVYDPVEDEWESIPPMFTARKFAGAASLGGKIFVVGGLGAFSTIKTGECYDPETKTWTRIPMMIKVSGCVKAVAIDGALFVADIWSNGIERYSPNDNIWESVRVSEDFQIEALCSLRNKYLPKYKNVNNNK